MSKERVLVTVKTYPTLSRRYGETVCTAGVREDGTWVRIYPVPFRRLEQTQQYKKFDWLECELVRNRRDVRPESHRPVDQSELVSREHMGTDRKWRERRRLLLETAHVHDRLEKLIDAAKANELSLAVFKPKRVLDFLSEEDDEREWNPDKLRQMRQVHSQLELFEDNSWRETFRVIPKLPYNFSYRFEDGAGRTSTLQILDWEVGALYWNCLKAAEGDEDKAIAKVRQKYFTEFMQRDLHFFLGTTQQYHFVAPNPWVIIGVFPIPYQRQLGLL